MPRIISSADVVWGLDGEGRYGVLVQPLGDVVVVGLARRNNAGRLSGIRHAEMRLSDLQRLEQEIQAAKEELR